MQNKKELRDFGLVMAVGLSVVAYLVLPFLFAMPIKLWPAIASVVFLVLALLWPASLALLYQPWMKLAHVLGFVNTTIILSVIFYLLITPMGIVLRRFGLVADKADANDASYKTIREQPKRQHLEKPY